MQITIVAIVLFAAIMGQATPVPQTETVNDRACSTQIRVLPLTFISTLLDPRPRPLPALMLPEPLDSHDSNSTQSEGTT